jgi:hypothetical protein
MRTPKSVLVLCGLIFALALFASAAGIFWPAAGQSYPFTSVRGEQVLISGRGLYQSDSFSGAVQEIGQDYVTLFLTLPVLAAAMFFAARGSLRGKLLLTGTIAYFLYTYMMMAFNTAYNPLFLVYVALFSLSLFAFVLSMMSYDLKALPGCFSANLPRRAIAGVLIGVGSLLFVAWLGRIVPPLVSGTLPELQNYTTLGIQAMDLGVIVPTALLAGILLLRRSAWGYLLGSVAVLKFLTYGTAVFAMGINMFLNGVGDSAVLVGAFGMLTLVNFFMAFLLLKNVEQDNATAAQAKPAL